MKTCIFTTLLFCAYASFGENKELLTGLGLDSDVARQEKSYTCDSKPPPARPAQFSGGEGIGPLPLPGVPLRRSEKKNPPQPPVLIVKIQTEGGPKDWNTNPGDTENLLRWMKAQMNCDFSSKVMPLDEALTGSRPKPTPEIRR